MFEARLVQGSTLKKIVEAIRELVENANLDCAPTGITMQVLIHCYQVYHNNLLFFRVGHGLQPCFPLCFIDARRGF